ncbi:YaaL family protein [Cerasibacillus sp. JNUCC 74]
MAKKMKKKDVDEELLDTIKILEREWKHMQSIVSISVEPTLDGHYWEAISRAKYLYLLREARHRRLRADFH